MSTLDELLKDISNDARKLGVHLNDPLPEARIRKQAQSIKADFGIEVPDEYIRLMLFTNGIETQRGYLSSLEEIRLQNIGIWGMEISAKNDSCGFFSLKFTPRKKPPAPEYLWLGYDGNSSEQIYDVARGEFHRRGLGCGLKPDNKERTLFGLLKFMAYRE